MPGLVGLPNAGKSTFLATVTAAKPKIADYPFTTLHPGLGVVRIDGARVRARRHPGLIEGAHEGAGLGDRFLGHVERCRVLLHLVDGTSEHAGEAYKIVRDELEAYGHGLAEKPEIVALSKADALDEETLKEQDGALKRAAKKRADRALLGFRPGRRGGAAGAARRSIDEARAAENRAATTRNGSREPAASPSSAASSSRSARRCSSTAARGRLNHAWLAALAEDIAELHGRGADVLVVSSGRDRARAHRCWACRAGR